MPIVETLSIEHADIPRGQWRNFAGLPGMFNAAGDRNFNIFLDPEMAEDLLERGWNVKYTKPKTDEYDPQPYLKVVVKYVGANGPLRNPPKVVLMTSYSKVVLDEETIGTLDHAPILNADIIIRPYSWEINGKTGVTAYLKAAYITLEEDDFEAKYRFEPDYEVE
ncbi:MAG TPA: hypothetical protein PKD68_00405 [Candidatus Saccharibacteria bacterium]|nr:hypothetical protein [Candidatus Saccharibacteria bacterium]